MSSVIDHCSKEVAKKVDYEIKMFRFAFRQIQSAFRETATFAPGNVRYVGTGSSNDDDDPYTDAMLECFLLHTRVLRDFFHAPSSRQHPDDVIAKDFVSEWDRLRPLKGAYLEHVDEKHWLDKALVHLTIDRVEHGANEAKWDIEAISKSIEAAIENSDRRCQMKSRLGSYSRKPEGGVLKCYCAMEAVPRNLFMGHIHQCLTQSPLNSVSCCAWD